MAQSTLKVKGTIGRTFKTDIECGHPFVIDQPKAFMGNDEGPNPLDVFLGSISACICAVGRIVANQKKLDVKEISVEVEGDINKDFLLGKTKEGKAGFTEIRILVTVDSPMPQVEKEEFVAEIQKRCPVADNIRNQSMIVAKVN